ncbi:MAG: hypothetical protein HGB12_11385 [Bacteroidetes bacterium]|nr:hypothetical protein [Bacteroidota bacterium]
MKKTIFLLFTALFSTILLWAQPSKGKYIEVLYFKANLACCKAKACNAIEADIQSFVAKNFPKGNVTFTEIKLIEESNKAIIEKYDAQSQTVILVKHNKKKDVSINVSDLVKKYMQDKNKEDLEKTFVLKINEFLK